MVSRKTARVLSVLLPASMIIFVFVGILPYALEAGLVLLTVTAIWEGCVIGLLANAPPAQSAGCIICGGGRDFALNGILAVSCYHCHACLRIVCAQFLQVMSNDAGRLDLNEADRLVEALEKVFRSLPDPVQEFIVRRMDNVSSVLETHIGFPFPKCASCPDYKAGHKNVPLCMYGGEGDVAHPEQCPKDGVRIEVQ